MKEARRHAGLTQKQLAPLAEMSQSNLSELETVAHGSSKTPQLAAACNVNAHWLATGEGQMLDLAAPASPRLPSPELSAPALVDRLVALLNALPDAARDIAAQRLATLAHAPDSQLARSGVELALTPPGAPCPPSAPPAVEPPRPDLTRHRANPGSASFKPKTEAPAPSPVPSVAGRRES